jgi:hypothetical protein
MTISATKQSPKNVLKEAIRSHCGLVGGRGREIHPCAPELHEFVLRHGKFHEPQWLPDLYELHAPNSCFGNATLLAVTHRLRYVEGFAMPAQSNYVAHHAWCLDDDARVIDPTWGFGRAYFGVVFDRAFACRLVGRVPNAMGLTANVWWESRTKRPTSSNLGPDKPLPLLRAAKVGWRLTDFVPVGILPNGQDGYVVFGRGGECFKPIKQSIANAGMELTGETHRQNSKEFWALAVLSKQGRALDQLTWDVWWTVNAEARAGIQPTKNLLRAMSHKLIAETWPPAKRRTERTQ